ncbi:MAG: Ig-like domain-containing protein [Thermoplasmatota archaeon]
MRTKLLICMLAAVTLLTPMLGVAPGAAQEVDQGVSIIKPEAGLYVFDVKLVPLPETPRPFQAIVIGKITVEAEATAAVSFYVDGELQHTDSEAPYEWVWDTGLQPPPIHTLRAEAGGESDEIGVLYINPFGG